MSKIFIATGSNIGDRLNNLNTCLNFIIEENFKIIECSNVYESPAVDYLEQPDFLNQVCCLSDLNSRSPLEALACFKTIEQKMGRVKNIDKGPRNIDIDILFFGTINFESDQLTLPHPGVYTRSFFAIPLNSLESFKELSRHFRIPEKFDNNCWVYK